jgi:hypothetical protein
MSDPAAPLGNPAAADRRVERAPAVGGRIDADYLAGALRRAGRAGPVGTLSVERLDGGRVTDSVFALRCDAGRFVLKRCAARAWRAELFGMHYNEGALWLAGATRHLPHPLTCPTIDVGFDAAAAECWVLMDDVSHGIPARGRYDEAGARRLLEAVARLHARHWDDEPTLAGLPLLTVAQHTRMLCTPCAAVGGRAVEGGWVDAVLDQLWVFRRYVPRLLEVMAPADADFYLTLCQDPLPWLAPLAQAPHTLIHGDLRRANLALLPDAVSLFDWDFAARAPAALDIGWYAFLHFWAYPPDDGRTPEDREQILGHHRTALADTLGPRFDAATHDRCGHIGWLKAFAQLAFCLADPLADQPTPDDVARVRLVVRRATDRARRIVDDIAPTAGG